ncbi:hypothetical protein [Microcoleus sp. D3_18a_C4]|uniref:hypothetical protein n=1 Tax=Microcoleus sp. D3_18a_C4 TaxID=3055332 RepID=UPI002FD62526
MAADFFYFDIHYAIELHDWIIENSGGFPGSNNPSLLESALSCCAFNLYGEGGQDAHPTRGKIYFTMQFKCGLA